MVGCRRKRLHQQINPIVRDGKVRDEYADLLANKEYTSTTLKELQDKALEWILRRGGIVKTAKIEIILVFVEKRFEKAIRRRYINRCILKTVYTKFGESTEV